MPGWVRTLIDLLKKLFPRKKMRIDVDDEEMHIRDKHDEYQVDEVVVAMVGFDPETGQFFRLGIWTQPQIFEDLVTFNDDVRIANDFVLRRVPATNLLGIYNYALTDYMPFSIGEYLYMAIGGASQVVLARVGSALQLGNINIAPQMPQMTTANRNALTATAGMVIHNTTTVELEYYIAAWKTVANLEDNQTYTGTPLFNGNISLPVTGLIGFGDLDTYIDEGADDVLRIVRNSAVVFQATGGILIPTTLNTYDAISIRDRVGDPAPIANYSQFYAKDVGGVGSEGFVQDDAGNATQLSAHDKDGFHILKSSIPKRELKVQIDIERFIRDKYPQYIKEEPYPESEHPKPGIEEPLLEIEK